MKLLIGLLFFGFSQFCFADIKDAEVTITVIEVKANGKAGNVQELEKTKIKFDTGKSYQTFVFDEHRIGDSSFRFTLSARQTKMAIIVYNFVQVRKYRDNYVIRNTQYGVNKLIFKDLTSFLTTDWGGSFNYIFEDRTGVFIKVNVRLFP